MSTDSNDRTCLRPLLAASALALALSASARANEIESWPHNQSEEQGHVHGSHPECPAPASAKDVVDCARKNHPEVRQATLESQRASTLKEAAAQLPNPELEGEGATGTSLGDRLIDAKIALIQPIDLFGKRSANVRAAEAQGKRALADLHAIEADTVIETVVQLHRLRQIQDEKALLQESAGTFAKLVAQYKTRPRLSAEEEVSLSVYEIAETDNRLKLTQIQDEERALEDAFHLATGHGLSEILKVLPKSPKTWPELAEKKGEASLSPELGRLNADLTLALADQDSARAESWPELGIGPMIQLQADGPIHSQLYGIQLRLELPVLSWNGGGRAHAARGVSVAEKAIEIQSARESHLRAQQIQVYNSAVRALKEALPAEALEKRHKQVERLSERGLVSSALAIEAHRGRLDLEESRNQRELKAIQALWTVRKLDGRVFEETP